MEEGLIDRRDDDLLGISRPMRHCGGPEKGGLVVVLCRSLLAKEVFIGSMESPR